MPRRRAAAVPQHQGEWLKHDGTCFVKHSLLATLILANLLY